MYTIHDRINSRKRYEWNAQISTDDAHTHNVNFYDQDGQVHGRIRKVEIDHNGTAVKGDVVAEKIWDKGDHPNDDETRRWIFESMKSL